MSALIRPLKVCVIWPISNKNPILLLACPGLEARLAENLCQSMNDVIFGMCELLEPRRRRRNESWEPAEAAVGSLFVWRWVFHSDEIDRNGLIFRGTCVESGTFKGKGLFYYWILNFCEQMLFFATLNWNYDRFCKNSIERGLSKQLYKCIGEDCRSLSNLCTEKASVAFDVYFDR